MATPEKLLSLKNQEKMKKIKSNKEDDGVKTVGGPESTWSTADYAKFSFDATAGVKPDTSIPAKVKGEKMHSIKEAEEKDEDETLDEELYAEETDDEDTDGDDTESRRDADEDEDIKEAKKGGDGDADADDADTDGEDGEESDDDDIGDDDQDAEDEDEGLYLELADIADEEGVKLTDLGADEDEKQMDEFMSPFEEAAEEEEEEESLMREDSEEEEEEEESAMREGKDEEEEEEEEESLMREDSEEEEEEEEEESLMREDSEEEEEEESVMREAKRKEEEEEEEEEGALKESKIRISFKLDESAKLFDNNTVLSEEDKRQSRALFESAVRVTAKKIGAQIQKEYQSRYDRAKKLHERRMEKKIDQYLSYVVEQWAKENQVGLRNQLQNRLTENFLRGLKNLFVEHYIEVPESKVNVVEALAKNVKSLKKQLKESEARAVRVHTEMKTAMSRERKALMKEHRARLISEAAAAVIPADRGQFIKRAETMTFSNTKNFKKDLVALREQYFGAGSKSNGRSTAEPIAEPLFESRKPTTNSPVDTYAKALDKLVGGQS